ncbi:hypothetical protein ACFX15_021565 [Malus domestica]
MLTITNLGTLPLHSPSVWAAFEPGNTSISGSIWASDRLITILRLRFHFQQHTLYLPLTSAHDCRLHRVLPSLTGPRFRSKSILQLPISRVFASYAWITFDVLGSSAISESSVWGFCEGALRFVSPGFANPTPVRRAETIFSSQFNHVLAYGRVVHGVCGEFSAIVFVLCFLVLALGVWGKVLVYL